MTPTARTTRPRNLGDQYLRIQSGAAELAGARELAEFRAGRAQAFVLAATIVTDSSTMLELAVAASAAAWREGRRAYLLGQRLRTLVDDCDTTPNGRTRYVRRGTIGTVVNVADSDGLVDIVWRNGAWTRWTFAEVFAESEAVTCA